VITPYDTLIKDILDRLVAIEETIILPAPIYDGKEHLYAIPRFWDSIARYPFVCNRWSGLNPDDTSRGGAPLYADILTFEMRLIVGSLNSGYIGDREDTLNLMVYEVINRFRQVPYLNDPITGEPLRYLAPGRNATLITGAPNGTTAFQMGDILTLGCNFNLSVRTLVQIDRLPGSSLRNQNGNILLVDGDQMTMQNHRQVKKAGT